MGQGLGFVREAVRVRPRSHLRHPKSFCGNRTSSDSRQRRVQAHRMSSRGRQNRSGGSRMSCEDRCGREGVRPGSHDGTTDWEGCRAHHPRGGRRQPRGGSGTCVLASLNFQLRTSAPWAVPLQAQAFLASPRLLPPILAHRFRPPPRPAAAGATINSSVPASTPAVVLMHWRSSSSSALPPSRRTDLIASGGEILRRVRQSWADR